MSTYSHNPPPIDWDMVLRTAGTYMLATGAGILTSLLSAAIYKKVTAEKPTSMISALFGLGGGLVGGFVLVSLTKQPELGRRFALGTVGRILALQLFGRG